MQAVKNMTGTAKQQVANAAAVAQEKKDVMKAAVEEKMDKMRAHNEEEKEEATLRKTKEEAEARRLKDEKIAQHDAERHPEKRGPIGNKPTPADLDMPAENPNTMQMPSDNYIPNVPHPLVPGPRGGVY